ncbi:MAG: hypothetical protein K8R36_20045 [Planctomycetales bacterium]|nr:hypothetical protein [Planctomycetales bacterium]
MDPKPATSRFWQMTLIVIVEILVSAAMWFVVFWGVQRRLIHPFFDWRSLGALAITFSQLLMLAVVTALWDFKRSVRWLLIFPILVAEGVLVSPLMVITSPTFQFSEPWSILLPQIVAWLPTFFGLILTIGVASILLLHILLWPVRNLLGWRIYWAGEATSPVKPQFSIWHLLLWTALIAALLSLFSAVGNGRLSFRIPCNRRSNSTPANAGLDGSGRCLGGFAVTFRIRAYYSP